MKRRTLNPVWGERFFASASKTLLGSERVLVALYDHDVLGSHDHLGSVEIPIEAVEEECPRRNPSASIRAHWVRLGPPPPPPRRDRGRAKLAARFDPDVPGRLHVWVVGAVGLEAADSNGSSDPYVRVTLLRHLAAGETAKRDDRRRTATRAWARSRSSTSRTSSCAPSPARGTGSTCTSATSRTATRC